MPPSEPDLIVSPRIYALILASPRLKRRLLPEGFICSPYKVLDYDNTLVLEDTKGSQAVFRRRQRIQFQQDGVSAILDHFWGNGITAAEYSTSAGRIIDSFKDGSRRHLVIQLKRPMRLGEILEFTVERRSMEMFTQPEGWEETTIDHPIHRLSRTIRFPKARPCQTAQLECNGQVIPLHVLGTKGGTTEIGLRVPKARPDTPYVIRWFW
ncbi:MAG: hypothetical protein ACKVVP_21185 [Chloroflexota bacterium]